jgi:RHS repeat-associated protein
LNRLTSASEGTSWSRAFGYDIYGNMWVNTAGGTPGVPADSFTPRSQSWINAANNRLVNSSMNVGYDSAGNLTSIGSPSTTYYAYDAENRMTSRTLSGVTATYGYDGEGRRVQKVSGGNTTTYVYDAAGQLAAEYTSVAPPAAPCTTCYLTVDHLGSTRMMTDGSGVVKSLTDYLPFGEEIPATVGGRSSTYYPASTLAVSDTVTEKFTGKERDVETGLDYFGARYYSGAQGRFASADKGSDQHPRDPQSWNLYSYARNNPLIWIDPSGNYICATMTTEQCNAFQKALDKAQTLANGIKDKYGAESDQYRDVQRAIDAYGLQNVDNGVIVDVAPLSVGGASTVAYNGGVLASLNPLNPTGQEIHVTISPEVFGTGAATNTLVTDIAHEGSHVADAKSWALAGFTYIANPTKEQTEFKAYGVTAAILQTLGAQALSASGNKGPRQLFWMRQLPDFFNDVLRDRMIKTLYPDWAERAFGETTHGSK